MILTILCSSSGSDVVDKAPLGRLRVGSVVPTTLAYYVGSRPAASSSIAQISSLSRLRFSSSYNYARLVRSIVYSSGVATTSPAPSCQAAPRSCSPSLLASVSSQSSQSSLQGIEVNDLTLVGVVRGIGAALFGGAIAAYGYRPLRPIRG